MFVTERTDLMGPRWIINFPTKQHWRGKTRLEWIDEGLVDLKRVILEKSIRSIAIPPLGTGNGGPDWSVVEPRIDKALSTVGRRGRTDLRAHPPISQRHEAMTT